MMYRIAFCLITGWLIVTGLTAQTLPLNTTAEVVDLTQSWETNRRWEDVRDVDGRFRALVPAAWEHRIDSVTTAVGDLAYHTYWLQTPTDTSDNVMYMLSYVDYPDGSLHHDSTELVTEFLDASQEEAAERMSGEVLFSTERERNGFPGRYWRIDYLDGEASVRTQAFVAGNRYYALQTVSKSNRGVNASTEKYFAGFEIFAPDGTTISEN